MNKDVFEILKSEGYEVGTELQKYYKNVDLWEKWWKGYVSKFHRYYVTNIDKKQMKMDRVSMKMAKKVSEDWANLLLNDKTAIKIEDEKAQHFVTGDGVEQHGGVFGLSKFWKNGNRTIEKEFGLGTCAFILSLESPKLSNQKLIADNVRIKYIKDPRNIIPLSWDDTDIYECAFASTKVLASREYIYLQTMTVEKQGYRIKNMYFIKNDNGYEKTLNPNGEVEAYYVPSKPFHIISPNIENNISDVPLGMSVFSDAIDQLKSCDVTFDNFYTDFLLGRKKVFMGQDAISTKTIYETDEKGTKVPREVPDVGDTIEQSLYVAMGKALPGEPKLFEEYNPSIRVAENKEGVQLSLNLLSSKVGLGQNRYQFQSNSMNTATEVKASNKDLTESVWKQRILVQDVLVELVRAILIIGKEKCGQTYDEEAKISVQFDDTMFSDEEAERLRDMQEVTAGLLPAWKYKVKWQGMSDTDAKEEVEENKKGISFGEDGDE